ncbi:uncharacterized protein [Coffea arabica]|uniref:Uncharacterized protein n=1 Tax=Coffea arabica TaxID=13443 RepID=A0A6P6URP8_COFAR|nr:uncharacterized protein LOC113713877 [Coffea arabica]
MWSDLLVQAGMILFTIFMFLYMQNIPQKFFSKLRLRGQANVQAKRHFIKGAQLYSQAKLAKDRSSTSSLAKSAEEEADVAIALDSKDAAAHILKALVLELRGLKAAAIDTLDTALSPGLARSLSGEERGDALFKRAELRLALSRRGQVDSAVEDLVESVKLKGDNARAYCLLGDSYKKKGMVEEAKKAYEDALKVQPTNSEAREELERLAP